MWPRAALRGASQAWRWPCLARPVSTSPQWLSVEVKMPSLSPTMSEGTIVGWKIKEGESLGAGDVLAEIQTDKAVVSLEVDEDGTLAKIVKDANSGPIKVGELIAVMAEEDEDWKEVAANFKPGDGSSAAAAEESSGSSSEAEEAAGPTGGSTPGTQVKMPAMSPTMTEGTLVKWSVKEGEKFSAGDVIAEIQTDKAVVSLEADEDAVMAKILVPEGESGIQVGRLIALTVEEGEDWQDVQIPAPEKKEKPAAVAKKSDSSSKAAEAGATGEAARTGEHKFVHAPKAGPATNLLLTQYGLDPSQVPSSGPKGITKGDVLRFIMERNLQPIKVEAAPAKAAKQPSKAAAPPKPTSGYTDHPLSSMRSVIAKRLTESKQTSPHGHCTVASNIDAIVKLRKDFMQGGIKVSLNDFVIKAVGTTLQHVPEMNLNIKGDDFQIMPNVDISIAVATDAGLITPIVTDVPNRSLGDIASVVRDLATRARDNKLQLHEFQGGTFTISNLGMFGIHEFTAIINPPQVGILAVGGGSQELCPNTGKAVTLMRSTLSFDRRFVDEALAADFMATLQRIIERPEFMNLGLVPVARQAVSS